MAKNIYNIIKKQNGETFAKAIRNYDNGIFDIPNIDKIVKYAGHDARPIMSFLISLKDIRIQEQAVHMNPIELLDKAGYDAYIVNTLKEQNAIRKYFAPNERLCTFRDPNRFKEYYIINAVRKDVDTIKRSDFDNPERDDEYGTSVLSIQILKSGGFISIKNRYNHTVKQCDNTLNSNPDNIIMGLSDAIRHYFDVDFSSQASQLPDKYTYICGLIIKYNHEINNVYLGDKFYVKDGNVTNLDPNTEHMIDWGAVLNTRDKTVTDVTNANRSIEFLRHEIRDKKIQIVKNEDQSIGGYRVIADGKDVIWFKDGELISLRSTYKGIVSLIEHNHLCGELDFSDAESIYLSHSDLSRVKKLTLPIKAENVDFHSVVFPALELDLSGIADCINMEYADLSRVTKLTPPKNARSIRLGWVKLPQCELDFSNAKRIDLSSTNLRHIQKLILPKNAESIFLNNTTLPECELDFTNIPKVYLRDADLSCVKKLKLPQNLRQIDLARAILPKCEMKFENVSHLILCGADLSHVKNLTFDKKISLVDLRYAILPKCELNLSDATIVVKPPNSWDLRNGTEIPGRNFCLAGANLSRVTKLILPKNIDKINLSKTIMPACELDLSNATEINLESADLSLVTKLILPENGANIKLTGAKLPPHYTQNTQEFTNTKKQWAKSIYNIRKLNNEKTLEQIIQKNKGKHDK